MVRHYILYNFGPIVFFLYLKMLFHKTGFFFKTVGEINLNLSTGFSVPQD